MAGCQCCCCSLWSVEVGSNHQGVLEGNPPPLYWTLPQTEPSPSKAATGQVDGDQHCKLGLAEDALSQRDHALTLHCPMRPSSSTVTMLCVPLTACAWGQVLQSNLFWEACLLIYVCEWGLEKKANTPQLGNGRTERDGCCSLCGV